VPAAENWTPQEQFVWNNVCVGDAANLATAPRFGTGDDAKSSVDFPPLRILRSAFLETILLNDDYRRVLTRRGVRILGARFVDQIDLENAEIKHDLTLENCQLVGGVNFSGLTSTRGITLSSDKIGSNVSIQLEGSHIAGSLNIRDSEVAGEIRAHTIVVGEAIYLNEGAEFQAKIEITYAKIGESLNLAGATFLGDVDVEGTQIGADLNLDGASWGDDSNLNLHNARADSIPALSDPWPPKLELNGFSYRSVNTDDNSIPPVLIKQWFAKQDDYSAQSYEQLAQVFQNRGAKETATNIRYASKNRERREIAQGWMRFWLTAQYGLIGYGYHPELAVLWIMFIIFLGAGVLRVSGEGPANGLPYGIAYSFDTLLPIIRLREMHSRIDLKGWARYYFYAHRIAGWVLAFFLVAGVSGLIK
jgi:hypothetical protein